MRATAILATALLTAATLSGCSVTVVNSAPSGANPAPSSTSAVEDAKLRSDIANAKVAVIAYATDDDGNLPPTGDDQEPLATRLAPYGWTQAQTTKSIVYRTEVGPSGEVFCIVAKGESGAGYVVTTNTKPGPGTTCPTVRVW